MSQCAQWRRENLQGYLSVLLQVKPGSRPDFYCFQSY